MNQPLYPKAGPHSACCLALMVVGVALWLGSLSGCVGPEVMEHVRDQISANEGHAADGSLGDDARRIGRVNADQWHVQALLIDDVPLPEDVAERVHAVRGQ